jgi:hypothetical protein
MSVPYSLAMLAAVFGVMAIFGCLLMAILRATFPAYRRRFPRRSVLTVGLEVGFIGTAATCITTLLAHKPTPAPNPTICWTVGGASILIGFGLMYVLEYQSKKRRIVTEVEHHLGKRN